MTLSVRERADTLGTLRYASVFAMETLARWVPTTLDLEAKVVFGRHIWEFAQHADVLGKRTHELRTALHHTPAPLAAYEASLQLLRATEGARERVEAFYDVFAPDLATRYRAYLVATDPFLDEPSVRVVERILADFPRIVGEAAALRQERPHLTSSGAATAGLLRDALGAAQVYVNHRPPTANVAESLA